VKIAGADLPKASFTVPDDTAKGQTVHIICEVTEIGTPPLTRYRRVIVEFSTRSPRIRAIKTITKQGHAASQFGN
jgi:hypothetical protein